MDITAYRTRRKFRALALVALAIGAAGMVGVHPERVGATGGVTVNSAAGSAYNYTANMGLSGSPPSRRGVGQSIPPGDAGSASPSVSCPPGGGDPPPAVDPDGARAMYGSTAYFGGIRPPASTAVPPSGPLTSDINCQLGPNGSVTASTSATLSPGATRDQSGNWVAPTPSWTPPGGSPEPWPGGVSAGPFQADSVHSTCTAAPPATPTGSATVVNGQIVTITDHQTGAPLLTYPVSGEVGPNLHLHGELNHFTGQPITENFDAWFGHQHRNPDGSLTVEAAHIYFNGPTNVGEVIIGSVTCGPVSYSTPPATPMSVFRPSNGIWFLPDGAMVPWGTAGDIPVPGDYDGNGTSDIAVYRPSEGLWFIQGEGAVAWGTASDIPVPADYDDNGTTDIAVYQPSTGTWLVRGGPTAVWGMPGDIPVPADYYRDGRADFAVFRPSTGTWLIRNPVSGNEAIRWGTSGDIPVPMHHGGGTTGSAFGIAVFRPSIGVWFIRNGPTVPWGTSGDIPVMDDYDGDGTDDIAVFRPSTGVWFVHGGATAAWGTSGDVPLPLPDAIRRFFFPPL